jgi:hypothetical protein
MPGIVFLVTLAVLNLALPRMYPTVYFYIGTFVWIIIFLSSAIAIIAIFENISDSLSRVYDVWHDIELPNWLKKSISEKDSTDILSLKYFYYGSRFFYLSLTIIGLAGFLSIAIGAELYTIFASMLLVASYQGLTYRRVKRGQFGLNATEALELIAFLGRRGSISGPTRPFFNEGEFEALISEAVAAAAEVRP